MKLNLSAKFHVIHTVNVLTIIRLYHPTNALRVTPCMAHINPYMFRHRRATPEDKYFEIPLLLLYATLLVVS